MRLLATALVALLILLLPGCQRGEVPSPDRKPVPAPGQPAKPQIDR